MCQTLRVGVEADAVPHGLQSSCRGAAPSYNTRGRFRTPELRVARDSIDEAIQQRVASTGSPLRRSEEAVQHLHQRLPDVLVPRRARASRHRSSISTPPHLKKSSPVPHRIIPSTSNNLTDNDSVASRSSFITEASANCASAGISEEAPPRQRSASRGLDDAWTAHFRGAHLSDAVEPRSPSRQHTKAPTGSLPRPQSRTCSSIRDAPRL